MTTRLTLAPYLDSWNHTSRTLAVNLLVVPDGNPKEPPGAGLPAFVAANLVVVPRLFAGADLPARGGTGIHVDPITLVAPASRRSVIDAVDRTFKPPATPAPPTPPATRSIKKHLPDTYRSAFPFSAPRVPNAFVGGEYREALRCGRAVDHEGMPTAAIRSWGEALAYVMRQPAILRAAGMLYTISVAIPTSVTGGWLAFELDPSGDYGAASAVELKLYMTRIPELPTGAAAPVFTGVLFPFVSDPSTLHGRDEALDESIRFADGFAKIVHAAQPETMQFHQLDETTQPPKQELGIRLAWDDEDVLAGMNRHLADTTDKLPPGAAGYRIDVREGTSGPFHSLAAVTARDLRLDGLSLGSFDGELRLEVHPQRVAQDEYWFLPYYTTWSGGSSVIRDPLDRYLRRITTTADDPNAIYEAVPSGVELRYGRTYQFRVRMADLTGGGPRVTDEPVTLGEAPIATVHYRRHVPPGRVSYTQTTEGLSVVRPTLGYPAICCAAGAGVLPQLRSLPRDTSAELPDPDAKRLEIRVMVRRPAFDPDAEPSGYRTLYTAVRAFPDDTSTALALAIDAIDTHDAFDPGFPAGADSHGAIRIPTARDVRLELRALGDDASGTYFGSASAARGPAVACDLHRPASSEVDLFGTLGPATALRAVFSRSEPAPVTPATAVIPVQSHPTSAIVARLADGLALRSSDATLLGPAGRRVVFGCAGAAHRLAPDQSSLTFLSFSELVGTWTCAVRVDLERDWSWKGLADRGIRVVRTMTLDTPGATPVSTDLGSLQVLHTASATAIEGAPDRDHTTIVFVDVFRPLLDADELPYETIVEYRVTANVEAGGSDGSSIAAPPLSIRIPVVTPPKAAPKVVAVGHAESPYAAADDYSSTSARNRMLWIELDGALDDPRDALFARVLAHAPDPLLLSNAEPVADPPPYPDLPVEPELARVIVPGEGDDHAGVHAMQALVPATRHGRFYLLPLPPGVHEGSPELFGFYTYELRIGHPDGSMWSTARGRFGPPLVLEGVQHPAPPLKCTASRSAMTLTVEAPYAAPFYDGASIQPAPPQTEIWVVLYAQVPQADGSGPRNIQVDTQRGLPVSEGRNVHARREWPVPSVEAALTALGLPVDAPLSVLAVETLPEPLARHADPLGADLGHVRLVRCSALVHVNPAPC